MKNKDKILDKKIKINPSSIDLLINVVEIKANIKVIDLNKPR